MNDYVAWLLLLGVACFGAAWVPHLVRGKPISFPMLYVALGAAVFALPLGFDAFDPRERGNLTERLAELAVIVSLTGVGLRLGRPVGIRTWGSTWRLLAVTMPLSIAAVAAIGWWGLGLSLPAAVLLGSVLAPTDPVLAAEVQIGPPLEGRDTEVRFALTSEAGLNDGLAFPFTNLAIALAGAGAGLGWLVDWAWYDVAYKVGAGVLCGLALGRGMAFLMFRVGHESRLARNAEGIVAIAMTLISYAVTEFAHGYGFLAVFVTAVTVRQYERHHEYHRTLHEFGEDAERILTAVILVLFGGWLSDGVLAPLTWPAAVLGLLLVFVVRPAAGAIGLFGTALKPTRRLAIAFFGIRGVGSIYYLAHALGKAKFANAELLWATVAFTILLSVVVHGATAPFVIRTVERGAPVAPEPSRPGNS